MSRRHTYKVVSLFSRVFYPVSAAISTTLSALSMTFVVAAEILSINVYRTFFKRSQSDDKKCQLNAVYGLLHRSHSENMVQSETYDLAKAQIDNWQIPSTASPLELSILPSRAVTSRKIFRSQGDFLAARERLESCLNALAVHE